MAADIPGNEAPTKAGNFLLKKMGGLPVWAWGLIGLAGIGLGYYFVRKQNTTSNQATASSPTASTLASTAIPSSEQVPNTTGDQVYIVQTPTPANSGDGTGTGGTGTGTGTGGTGTPVGGPIPFHPLSTIQIRPKQTTGEFSGYDAQHNGVPLRSSPGGAGIGQIPFDSSVSVTGNAQSGTETGGNSTIYFPVSYQGQTGWVSALDLVGIGSGGGGGLPRQAWRKNMLTEVG